MKLNIPLKFNLSTVLAFLGWACVQGPSIDAASAWLVASGIPHVVWLVRALGCLSLMLSALSHILPAMREPLSKVGLATPPGQQAPWNPAKDNVISAPNLRDPTK